MRNLSGHGKGSCAGTFALALALFVPGPVSAHEFWLEPHRFVVGDGEVLKADIRVGELFKGDVQPLIPVRAKRFTLETPESSEPVPGTVGDLPAVSMTVEGKGTAVLAYESAGDRITFNDWQRFADYLEIEGLTEIAARHAARGLSQDQVTEIYTRYAKALVSLGGESGADRVVGFPLELVALDDPFAAGSDDTIRIQLLFDGKPLADRQVSLFVRIAPNEKAPRIDLRSDSNGLVTIKLAGDGPWLISSVHMIEAPEGRNADWESLWASLVIGKR